MLHWATAIGEIAIALYSGEHPIRFMRFLELVPFWFAGEGDDRMAMAVSGGGLALSGVRRRGNQRAR